MALTYEYKVRDRSGSLVQGQLEGDSMALVVRRLREMGYMPISVTPKSNVTLKTEIKIPGITDRVKLKEVAVVTRQLSTMVDSGLSVVRSLGILANQVENAELRRVLEAVRLDVEHGAAFSAACAKHPKVFSHLFVTLVQAGEVGGNLDQVLGNLAMTMEKQANLNRTIRSAMTYPAVVLSVMVVIFVAMLIFIVPVFQNLFKTLGGKLPVPTQILIDVSGVLTSIWALLVIAVIVGAVVGIRKWIQTDDGRRIWDRLMLRPPVFGPLFHKVSLARVTSTLSSLITSGVPILESLDICSDTAGNRTVADVLQKAKDGVREGRPLADPLRDYEDVIPPLMVQMIEVGEQTGALDAMLRKVAEFYDQEVEATVNNLTALLEPLLTVVMGAGVGTMVICLYLPMFSYIKLIHN
ncbi:MAG: type II secretion system F family protein [Actinomycetota bacterium]|nr:type II secretion system F family protein [Actinomycetota bacterium]MDA8074957.1 type II secretion system F family protein [Actinomycetota bacterium]MDA8293661.1 type II secretion system F family protein [Actinomycetota bacterium]